MRNNRWSSAACRNEGRNANVALRNTTSSRPSTTSRPGPCLSDCCFDAIMFSTVAHRCDSLGCWQERPQRNTATRVPDRAPDDVIPLRAQSVSYTHLRAHETDSYLVCRLLLE